MSKQDLLKKIAKKKGYAIIDQPVEELKKDVAKTAISYRMKGNVKALLQSEADKCGKGYQSLLTDILDEWYESKVNNIKGVKSEPVILLSDLEKLIKIKQQG